MMLEKDYEEIAKKQTEKNIIDDYWRNIARTKTWISKDGTKTYFKDLEIAHIQRIINGLASFENENCVLVINKLVEELIVRIKRYVPKYAIEAVDKLAKLALENHSEDKKVIEDYKLRILANLIDEEGRRV